jgi:hypothetical protein
MVRPVKLASIKMGDVDDVGVYAGFAIHEWQQSDVAQKLKKLNIEPQMWKSGADIHSYGITVDLWCEEYDPEDMALARLTGLLDQPFRAKA